MNRDERAAIETAAAKGDTSTPPDPRSVIGELQAFNRSVSHDLRAPLAGIASLARLADDALKQGDDSVARRVLPLIANQSDCCSRMIEALLDLARVDQVELAPAELDLGWLIDDVIGQLSLSHPERRLPDIEVLPLPVVTADAELLRPALLNLIANAVKFTRDCLDARIEVGGHRGTLETTVFVRDNGVGFDPAAASQLFLPFVRLHAASHDGHGVGLSIVRSAVQRHGGRVWAESSPGRGACFYFTLPSPPRSALAVRRR